jgi:hypothetical protein
MGMRDAKRDRQNKLEAGFQCIPNIAATTLRLFGNVLVMIARVWSGLRTRDHDPTANSSLSLSQNEIVRDPLSETASVNTTTRTDYVMFWLANIFPGRAA